MSPTILTDKIEATRLADALRRLYGQRTHHSVRHGEVCGLADYRVVANEREMGAIPDAAALLERWPDGSAVARVHGTTFQLTEHGQRNFPAHGTLLYTAPPDQSERVAALEAELARATGEGRSLAAALDAARNGILWYHDTYPDSVNDSDHDALRQIDAALQGHVATESERIAALEAALEQARVALERIRHATAPTHDDGGHHEAAHDLSIDALRAIEEVRK